MNSATAAETDDLDALDDDSFRLVLRRWLAANSPAELRTPPHRLDWNES